jgi:hypothetical protein
MKKFSKIRQIVAVHQVTDSGIGNIMKKLRRDSDGFKKRFKAFTLP